MKIVKLNPYYETLLAHLGKLQWIRAGVKGKVDYWPLMAEWIECKTEVFTIESNCIEVPKLTNAFSGKWI